MIDISKIMLSHERVNIEVKAAKSGVPLSLWETYSSFANTFGGTILLGVDEDKETNEFIPIGIDNPEKFISDIWNSLNNPQKISSNILLENHIYNTAYEEKNVIVIEVPRADRRDKPIYVGSDMFKGTFRRNHEGDYHCTKEEIKAMLRDQADTSSDALILDSKNMDALNNESVRRYRILFDNIKPSHVWSKLSTDEFLIKIGAAKKSSADGKVHPTLGGLVFFGDFINIIDELPHYFLDYREHMVKNTRWSDRVSSGDGDWSGNIFDFYFRVIERLTSDIKTPFKLDDKLMRVDNTPMHTALREVLANALIHADYYGTRGIVIDKELEKITVSNPGTFRIGIEEAIAGGISDARNSRIFNMFSLINVGERSGTGLCDLFNIWEENGLEKPKITELVDPIERITVTLQINCNENEGNPTNNEGNPTENEGNPTENEGNPTENEGNFIKLTQTEMAVYDLIRKNPLLSAKSISENIGKARSTVERAFAGLQRKQYIRREGKTRGKWVVLK